LFEVVSVLLVFILLCVAAGLGFVVRRRLPERNRSRETVELMQITIGMLATFAAIVLGLLTASVKQSYDSAARDRQQYALNLTQLDVCLRDYGPEADPIRSQVRSYVAAVIASTWPNEAPPRGVSYPSTLHMPRVGASSVLERIMDRVGIDVSKLNSSDPDRAKIAVLCLERYRDVSHARLDVIEDARSQLSNPFYQVLVLWLMIMFACFGLVAPRNGLAIAIVLMSAVSLTSVMFVIVDLSSPYGGFFHIQSTTMRTALEGMMG
jgi:hypothetical protein